MRPIIIIIIIGHSFVVDYLVQGINKNNCSSKFYWLFHLLWVLTYIFPPDAKGAFPWLQEYHLFKDSPHGNPLDFLQSGHTHPYQMHTGRTRFDLFQISFSANTADAHPGVSGVSKDQKFCEKFKNTHCQVDHPAKME